MMVGMEPKTYSFIDIAVLEPVRYGFAKGDALAILDTGLNRLIWANGLGATLFGFTDVAAAIHAPVGLSPTTKRQIMALPGYPHIDQSRQVSVRLAGGISGGLVSLQAIAIRLPGGEAGLLLSRPAVNIASHSAVEIARAALTGLARDGQAAAIVDGQAGIVAATRGFSELGIEPSQIGGLVREVRQEQDRLVKRRIVGAKSYPAAIARLTDEPATHLLIVVDEAALEADEEIAPNPVQPEPARSATSAKIEPVSHQTAPGEPAPSNMATTTAEAPVRTFGRQTAPARFVWRIDTHGCFSAISDEFAQAVGPAAADVIGRSFRDVATVFGMDADGDVAGLLERRDTWSGRTLLWPIAGTALRAPVDLAALPVYGRERNFEGFRGFGVVRLADVQADPERIGLSLVPGAHVEPVGADIAAHHSDDHELVQTHELHAVPEDNAHAGEMPVAQPSEAEDKKSGDKVVQLAERKQGTGDKHLSPIERQAFREIGERLRKEQRQEEPRTHQGPTTVQDEHAPAMSYDRQEEPEERARVAASADDTSMPSDVLADAGQPPLDDLTTLAEADKVISQEDESDLRALDGFTGDTIDEHDHLSAATDAPADLVTAGKPTDTSILDKLPVPILIHSGDALHYANPEFLALTGYSSLEELVQAGGLDQLFVEHYGPAPEAETSHELRMRSRDGTEFPVEALLRFAPWAGGRALMLVVRQTGAAVANAPSTDDLRQRLAEMRTIVDTATDGVILIDRHGAIRSISQPAEALFGFDSDDVKGKPLISLFAIESQKAVSDYLANLSATGVASVLNDGREVIGREAEGRFIPMFMTVGRLPGEGGFCAVVRDITHWKRAEEQLTKARTDAEHASAQKSDFLARVSHEIRTPLNAIIGFSELMIDEKFGPISNDRYRDYLRDINRSGSHVLDLVNDLLDITKIEAGQQEMNYEAVSLNDALAEAVAIMQPQANRERVIIRSSFAPRLPDIVADLRSIRQIALNILSNAVRYTQAGGQVVISTAYEKNGGIAMRVRDTGVGMTQAELEQAMKPFQQINALKRARGDGTGLGLPLTKAMVEANRARFSISSNPGDGTLVEVTFPATRVLAQ